MPSDNGIRKAMRAGGQGDSCPPVPSCSTLISLVMWNYLVSIDWLQTYCLGNRIEPGEYSDGVYHFSVIGRPEETKLFRHVVDVYHEKLKVAVITQCPRSSVINPRCTLVKLENRVLYSSKYVSILFAIQKTLKLYYKGITRIDVACDFNTFFNGRSPQKFIKQYITTAPGDKKHIYRKGSDEFYIRGSKKRNAVSVFNYIRLGSKNSRVHSYIYDKTQELKDKKDKPWIRKAWERAGLVNDDTTHVWRAEISIHAEGTELLNLGTGQLFRLSPEYLDTKQRVDYLFVFYARKYMDFRKRAGSAKLSKYKKIKLFNIECQEQCVPNYIPTSWDSGRVEKICANRLRKILLQYTDLSAADSDAIEHTAHFLSMLSAFKSRTLQAKRNANALNTFKRSEFLYASWMAYLNAVDTAHKESRPIDGDVLYGVIGADMSEDAWRDYLASYKDAPIDALFSFPDNIPW